MPRYCLARQLNDRLARAGGIATLGADGLLAESQRPALVPSGGATVIQFASSGMDYPYINVNQALGPMNAAVVGVGSSYDVYYGEDIVGLPMTAIPFENEQGAAGIIPISGIITSFYAHWALGQPNNYDPSQIATVHAMLARSVDGSSDFLPIQGTRIDFSPNITFADIYGSEENPELLRPVRSGSFSGLNVPIAAGDRLLVVYWLTGNVGGIYLSSLGGAGVVVG